MGDKRGFGESIAEKRKFLRLTQEQLADKIGVSKSAVAKWETGGGLPDRDNLKRLAEVLNVKVDDLHRIIGNEQMTDAKRDINITADVITVLESYGYRVIGPDENNGGKV